MEYEIVVLSGDAVFARMLALEFSNLQISVMATVELQDDDRADMLILDLDSASAPSPDRYRKMIGFSRHPAIASPDARSCSMILRRPFQMSLFRREILLQLDRRWNDATETPFRRPVPQKRQIKLDPNASRMICDGREIALTPKEYAVLHCLLEHRGSPVSRERLAQAVEWEGIGNETDVYICYLRRKTDGLPNGRLIQTVRGKGYQIQ